MQRSRTWWACAATSLLLAACGSSNEIRHMSDSKTSGVTESKEDKKEK